MMTSKKSNYKIINSFKSYQELLESPRKLIVPPYRSSDKNIQFATMQIKKILLSSDVLEQEDKIEWLTDPSSYQNIFEVWLQYFLLIVLIKLKADEKIKIPISNISVKVIESYDINPIYLSKIEPFHYIVLSTGCAKIAYWRGLLQLLITSIGNTQLTGMIKTNYLNGTYIETAYRNNFEQAEMYFLHYLKMVEAIIDDKAYLQLENPTLAVLMTIELETIFDKIVKNVLQWGIPPASLPLLTSVNLFPLFNYLFLMLHELGHITTNSPYKTNKRNLKLEVQCDMLAIDRLLMIAEMLSYKNNNLLIPLSPALSFSILKTISFLCDPNDVSGYYANNIKKAGFSHMMDSQFGLPEFVILDSRADATAQFLASIGIKEEYIDMFFDCYIELLAVDLGIITIFGGIEKLINGLVDEIITSRISYLKRKKEILQRYKGKCN